MLGRKFFTPNLYRICISQRPWRRISFKKIHADKEKRKLSLGKLTGDKDVLDSEQKKLGFQKPSSNAVRKNILIDLMAHQLSGIWKHS